MRLIKCFGTLARAMTVLDPQRQIKDIPGIGTTLGVGKALKALPGILQVGESIQDALIGNIGGKPAIAVATQTRVIFIEKSLFSQRVDDFNYSVISSLQSVSGGLMSSVTILAAGASVEIKNVPNARAQAFANGLRARVGQAAAR